MYRHRLSQLRQAKLARIVIASALACVIAVPVAAGAAPARAGLPSAVVDSGPDWTVTQAAGGFAVSVTLPVPLPAVNDSPELVADGTVLGPADESAGGRTLSLTTMDPSVATAKSLLIKQLARWGGGVLRPSARSGAVRFRSGPGAWS